MSTHRFHPVKFFFMQKDLTEVKIFQKVLGGATFFEAPCIFQCNQIENAACTGSSRV